MARKMHCLCTTAIKDDGTSCRAAVRRAYDALCTSGTPERFAFEAALEVYRWHHPGVPQPEAAALVSNWLWNGVTH